MLALKSRRLAVDAYFRSRFDVDTSAGFALFGRITTHAAGLEAGEPQWLERGSYAPT